MGLWNMFKPGKAFDMNEFGRVAMEIKQMEPFIGEVYLNEMNFWGTLEGTCTSIPLGWRKFKESDVGKTHAGETEIFGIWRKNDQFFMYDDVYQPLRNKISKKYNNKSEK